MAFQPAVDCAEAIISYATPGGINLNVVNFKYATVYDQEAIDDLAAAIDGVVGVDFLPLIAGDSVYVSTHVRGLASTVDLESLNVASSDNGGASGGALPTNAAYCLSLRTGLTGRSARGRFYTVAMTTAHQATADTVTTTYRDAWIAALESMQSAASGVGWTWGVLSRQNNGVVLSSAVLRAITVVFGVNLDIDSQRRRLAGRGM